MTGVPENESVTAFLGIFSKRIRWGLSASGYITLLGLVVAVTTVALLGSYPFLAVTDRVDANLLVVEGWIQDSALQAGITEFQNGGYDRVFTTGGPTLGNPRYTSRWNTSASVAATRLVALGLPAERVQMVPAPAADVYRTYSSAMALNEWLNTNKVQIRGINIVTESVHARRTRLLFSKAFKGKVTLGVIAVSSPDYNGARWWRYSQGVRDVIDESIGYLYAKLFFCPFH